MLRRILLSCLVLLLMTTAFAEEAPLVEATAAPTAETVFVEPTEAPAEEAPIEETPAEEAPIEEVSAEEAPVEEASVEEEPIEAAPIEEEPVESVVEQLERLPLTGVKIGLDPGHQAHGNNEKETVAPDSTQTKAKVTTGATGVETRIPEYQTVLEIAFKLRDALQSQGAEVYMTRESHDVDISNQERAKMMNALGVDLVLRIHCDGSENRGANGIGLYCSRSNAIAEESYRAAEAILPRVCEATGAKPHAIVQNDNYTGQNWSEVPCIMVECGFLSNPTEDHLLNDPDYQWRLAAGLTDGIIDYITLRDGGEQADE